MNAQNIDIDYHQVNDTVQDKLITSEHISTKEQPADILTKALPSTTFSYLFNPGIQNISSPT